MDKTEEAKLEKERRYKRDYMREYYRRPENNKKQRESCKGYYKKNRKKLLEQMKGYAQRPEVRKRHRKYQREYMREYRKTEKCRAYMEKYSQSEEHKAIRSAYAKEYNQRPEVIARRKKKFQDPECRRRKNKQIQRCRYSKDNKCQDCGAHILNGSTYCNTCAQKEERSYNWMGGRTPYTGKFRYFIRYQVYERDHHTCQLCGRTELEEGCALSAHHIDYKKKNNDPLNLITLCRICHGWTTTSRAFWTEFFTDLLKSAGETCIQAKIPFKLLTTKYTV